MIIDFGCVLLYLFVLMAMFDIETSHVDNFTDKARSLMAPTISWGLFWLQIIPTFMKKIRDPDNKF